MSGLFTKVEVADPRVLGQSLWESLPPSEKALLIAREYSSQEWAPLDQRRFRIEPDRSMQKLVGMVIVALVLAAATLPTNARQEIRQGRSNLPAPPVTQQLLFITQYSPLETVGGAGSANRVIFRFVPGMWPPEPPYSGGGFALSGGDAGLFHVDPNSGLLSIGSTDVAARGTPYQFNVTVSGTHVSPVGVLVRPAGTAWIEVDNWNPIAGSSIT